MREHSWVVLEGDAGPIGCYEYWECSECGAQGGLYAPWHSEERKPARAWLRDVSQPLSMDCDQAKLETVEYRRGEQLEFNFTERR